MNATVEKRAHDPRILSTADRTFSPEAALAAQLAAALVAADAPRDPS
jgi:hypothetical protein